MKFSTNIVIEADTIQKEMKLQYDIEMEDPRYVLFGEYYDCNCAWLGIGEDADILLEELQEDADNGDEDALHKLMVIKHLRDCFPGIEAVLVDTSW